MGDNLTRVQLGLGEAVAGLSCGIDFCCARLVNNTVKCWGDNEYGQLGIGDLNERGLASEGMGDALPAVRLGANRTALQVKCGGHHACARLDDARERVVGPGQPDPIIAPGILLVRT
eukprot:2220140-Rhodomonas_salina.3